MLALATVIALTEVAAVYTNWFLRLWTQSFDRADSHTSHNDSTFLSARGAYYLKGYIIMACISLVLYGGRLCEYSFGNLPLKS